MITADVISRLHREAKTAQRRAYAPYSEFPVGVAIYTDAGKIVTGCNVENASFPLSVCAERNAIAACVAEGAGMPIACVVVGPVPQPLTPCGACRQVLAEFNREMLVICFSDNDDRADFYVKDLLPHAFSGEALDSSNNR